MTELLPWGYRLPMATSVSSAATDLLDAGCLFGLGAHLPCYGLKKFYTIIPSAAIPVFDIHLTSFFLILFFIIITPSLLIPSNFPGVPQIWLYLPL